MRSSASDWTSRAGSHFLHPTHPTDSPADRHHLQSLFIQRDKWALGYSQPQTENSSTDKQLNAAPWSSAAPRAQFTPSETHTYTHPRAHPRRHTCTHTYTLSQLTLSTLFPTDTHPFSHSNTQSQIYTHSMAHTFSDSLSDSRHYIDQSVLKYGVMKLFILQRTVSLRPKALHIN